MEKFFVWRGSAAPTQKTFSRYLFPFLTVPHAPQITCQLPVNGSDPKNLGYPLKAKECGALLR
jgi:hypothetical protein